MAQINTCVGDIRGNAARIRDYASRAARVGADMVVFPELAVTGYPPEDLLLKPKFISDNIEAVFTLACQIEAVTAVIGFVDRRDYIYNAAAVVQGGRVAGIYRKMFLPNYGVFDEERYFQRGAAALNVVVGDTTVGVSICEDIWYPEGPAAVQALGGAEVIVNINASPYHMGKLATREEMLATRAMDYEAVVVYCNLVGGQDELVFDGRSMILDEEGRLLARGAAFEEDLVIADLDIEAVARKRLRDTRRRSKVSGLVRDGGLEVVDLHGAVREERKRRQAPVIAPALGRLEEVAGALELGTRDYVEKNGFGRVLVGLSGGVDSALVAVVASAALGAGRVSTVYMPSRYSSPRSGELASVLAANLGTSHRTVAVDDIFDAYLKTLAPVFEDRPPDVTEENIQARIRGNILMALSNKFGWLVLTTGNKSEMSVGYATLYGDMAGGFAVIKDVPKRLVYELARFYNERAGRELIPEEILTRAPSAELRPGQTDQDTLPPYDVLDDLLRHYVEEDRSLDELLALGFDREVASAVVRMVDRSEYKRRQAPPGIKITPKAFGKDRRMPITNGYGG